VEDIGLLGVCIALGCGLVIGAFRLDREVGEGKTGSGGGKWERSSSESSTALILRSSKSVYSSIVWLDIVEGKE
jgi:hypothetical protein